jgi:hypothetical protein
MAVVAGMVLLASVAALMVDHGTVAADRRAAAHPQGGGCFGAAALDRDAVCPPSAGEPVPAPAEASQDRSAAYDIRANGKDCWSYHPNFPRNTCHFGDRRGHVKVVLAGNSHAGEWLPALQKIAQRQHWRIVTELASQCAMSDVTQMFPEKPARPNCRAWSREAAVRIRKDRPDLIVFANRMSLPARGHTLADSVSAYAAGMKRIFRQWKGIPVVLIRDTPAAGDGTNSVPDCLVAHPGDYEACNGLRAKWVPPDPGVSAAARFKNIRVLNLNNHICGPKVCAAVVGGVIPYFDGSHLSATYARTLAPYLEPALTAALGGRQRR